MIIFLVEPKGKIAARVAKIYDPQIWKPIFLIPEEPHLMYGVSQELCIEEVENDRVLGNNSLWLRQYSNGDKTYFEEISAENFILIDRTPIVQSHPLTIILGVGSLSATILFLVLRDENGMVEKSFWSYKEMEVVKELVIGCLVADIREREKAARRN